MTSSNAVMNLRASLFTLPLALAATGCIITSDGGGRAPVEDYTYPDAYAACSSDLICDPQDDCVLHELSYEDRLGRTVTVADGLCTHGCRDDLDCPESWYSGIQGACYDIGYGFLCYERCFVDSDCPTGFYCIDTVGGVSGDAICLPQ